jgi:hypothetical protein
VAHLKEGPSCGHSFRGGCRSEGLVFGEHAPDRLGELAGDLDAGDLLAALAPQAPCGALMALAIWLAGCSVRGCLEQRPAQVLRPVLARAAAVIALARLIDARA